MADDRPGPDPGWGQPPTGGEAPTPAPEGQPPAGETPTPPGSGWEQLPTQPSTGCMRFGLGAVLLGCLALVFLAVAAGVFFFGVADRLGIGDGDGASIGEPCPFLSSDEAREVLGGAADAALLTGLADASIGIFIDKRGLPDAEDCWISDADRTYLARVALHQGDDAAAVYAAERERAQPTSDDQGGGVTLEDPGYFAGEVAGLGDEAFCTGVSPAIMAGVVVRQGDRVVYVSVGPENEGDQPPDLGTEGQVVTAPALCELAQEVARAVLD
jgi:hypothetical protein